MVRDNLEEILLAEDLKLVESLESAASDYGWSSDQGSTEQAAKDLETLKWARAKLGARFRELYIRSNRARQIE